MDEVPDIPGSRELVRWFGSWPSFHDAEVLEIRLVRTGESVIRIHAFERTNDVDDRGYYVTSKHVIVSFLFSGIRDVHLESFNHQNVIWGLSLAQDASGIALELEGCFGVEGRILAQSGRIEFSPGIPEDRASFQPAQIN